MSEATLTDSQSRTPRHLWLVAILILLWNGSGAVTIMMAQAGTLPDMRPILAGTSRALTNTAALVVTCIILVLAVLQLIYARAMQQRGTLR